MKQGTKLLREHHKEVGSLMKKFADQVPLTGINELSLLSYVIGIVHDFGKYTTFFKNYLFKDETDGSGKHHHGLISAIFAAYAAQKVLPENHFSYAPLVSYFIVLHHHGDLRALELDIVSPRKIREIDFLTLTGPWRIRLKTLEPQLKDISFNSDLIEKEYAELVSDFESFGININWFCQNWRQVFESIYKSYYTFMNSENDDNRLKLFIIVLFLYSSLIDADKFDAANIEKIERKHIPADLVDRYRDKNPYIDKNVSEGINGIRNRIYTDSIAGITKASLENRIFTLTAPTGTGKTLTSLSCALKLRHRLENSSYKPRIIYSLPFTSIIDQNFDVIEDVLSCLPEFKNDQSAFLIKHHHLSDLRYRVHNEEKSLSESLMLTESWESEIIVTTFIQLFHTIIGFKNRFLKKYHNIAGSIIILDEVQNIPIEYWPLVRKMFKLISENLGCYIIFTTATRPLIFKEKETLPLLENSKDYFLNLDRVELVSDTTELSVDEFFQNFKYLYAQRKSYLIVFNTIKSSIAFFEKVKSDDKFQTLVTDGNLFYLSTGVVPADRSRRIKIIRDLLYNNKKILIISTQLVEAGIDIDLDEVIRDIGPIDSVIQVAGRCNRGMGGTKGRVSVVHLTDGNYGYAKYVYGTTHYHFALKLLAGKTFQENRFFEMINNYFNMVKNSVNHEISEKIWEAVKNYRFYMDQGSIKCISDFRLIKEKDDYVDQKFGNSLTY